MEQLYKLLNKPDLILSATKIHTCANVQQEALHLLNSKSFSTLELQSLLKISPSDFETVIQELLWKNDIMIINDAIVSKENYQQELETFIYRLKTEKRIMVSQVSKMLLQESALDRDDKYFYCDEFLRQKSEELFQMLSIAKTPLDLTVTNLGIDLELLNILKLKYFNGHDYGHWTGLVFVPKSYVINLQDALTNQLNKYGIVDMTNYEYLNLTQNVLSDSKEYYILDKYAMTREYMLKLAENIQSELWKKGFKQLSFILDVKISENILQVLEDHLQNTVRISDFYIYYDLVKVLLIELRDLVKEVAELIRRKKSKEKIEEIKQLGFWNVLKDYVSEEVQSEVQKLIETDFMRRVEEELKMTFKEDLVSCKIRDLRKKVRRIEAFHRGLELIKDEDLKTKLEKVLLKVKGQEVIQILGVVEDIKDIHEWKQLIKEKIIERIYDLEVEIEKEEYSIKLKEQLKDTKDAALALHLGVAILFIREIGYPVYFTGKHVPDVLMELKPHLQEDTFIFLDEFLRKIINQKKAKANLDDEIHKIKEML